MFVWCAKGIHRAMPTYRVLLPPVSLCEITPAD